MLLFKKTKVQTFEMNMLIVKIQEIYCNSAHYGGFFPRTEFFIVLQFVFLSGELEKSGMAELVQCVKRQLNVVV